jgi:hypothetical protein
LSSGADNDEEELVLPDPGSPEEALHYFAARIYAVTKNKSPIKLDQAVFDRVEKRKPPYKSDKWEELKRSGLRKKVGNRKKKKRNEGEEEEELTVDEDAVVREFETRKKENQREDKRTANGKEKKSAPTKRYKMLPEEVMALQEKYEKLKARERNGQVLSNEDRSFVKSHEEWQRRKNPKLSSSTSLSSPRKKQRLDDNIQTLREISIAVSLSLSLSLSFTYILLLLLKD